MTSFTEIQRYKQIPKRVVCEGHIYERVTAVFLTGAKIEVELSPAEQLRPNI